MQCTYPLAGLYRLFSVYKFESDTVGVGRIVHSALSTEGRWFTCINHITRCRMLIVFWSCTLGLQSPTVEPTIALQTPVPVTSLSRRPGYRPPAQYIKVSSFLKNLQKKGLRLNLDPVQKKVLFLNCVFHSLPRSKPLVTKESKCWHILKGLIC